MITVIVPVYNNEKYLNRCIDSLINQTFKQIKILLIDDGSSDESGDICDLYLKTDDRIKVIHKKNEGLVSARKLGAREAETEYITFVDSDDWIEPNAVERMIKPIIDDDEIELTISGIIFDKDGSRTTRNGYIKPGCYKDNEIIQTVIPHMMYSWDRGEFGIMGSVCGKVYKKDLFQRVIEKIDNRITYGEDDALVYALIPLCKKMHIISEGFYHYCIRADSMATSYSLDSFIKLELLKHYFETVYREYGLWYQLRNGVNQILWMFIHQALRTIYGLSTGYQFPYNRIPVKSNIILYGAGAVGRDYYNALIGSGYANPVAWVDMNYLEKQREGLDVNNPECVDLNDCDSIVICIEAKESAAEIKNYLIKKGVHTEKIFWEMPRFLYT